MQNGTVNGVHRDPAITGEHELTWDALPPSVTRTLEQPLDPSLVSRRKGRAGRTYDYLEGHVAIDQANRVFGYGGWGYQLIGDVTLRRIEAVDARTGEVSVSHAYSAPVRVTVAGAQPRTDLGFHAVTEETPEGHDMAAKGAVTDGMKRALRSFGLQFGNGLYGSQSPQSGAKNVSPAHSRQGGEEPAVTPGVESLRKKLIDLGAEQGFDGEQVRRMVSGRTGRDLEDLGGQELTPLVESAERKVRERRRAA